MHFPINFGKIEFRRKMEDDFLTKCFSSIHKEIVERISVDSMVDDFASMKECRVPFK